jgi:hypothetical protein
MTDMSDSSAAPGEEDSPKPPKLLRPKRGAFPTPESEIEKAKSYIPETDAEGEEGSREGEPDQPADVDGEVDGEEEG